ncbi:dihydropteroate synthase [Actinoplanes sp. GCM10030250]|uniref:dihydropteroate synthase n=1 Tax=Actinoplanes sp. GCM10030250 TaxID=3273376 RepID=UPI00361B5800
MGVLNVTPDSFSDGGRYTDVDAAVHHGIALFRQGAHVIDVGGESTRPGAERVDAATEIARVVPVIERLFAQGVPVSIDTTRAAVAEAALTAGAVVINDVSGGLADPGMAAVAAAARCPWVLMHWRGHSRDMQKLADYRDVVTEVRDELRARADEAVAGGVDPSRIILDPGLGFAKRAEHNWALSAHLDVLIGLGFPVLFGASRKTYLGHLLAGPDGTPRPVAGREAATLATSVLAVAAGAWGVRVHEVGATADALSVWRATGSPKIQHHIQHQGVRDDDRRRAAAEGRVNGQITLTGLRARGRHGVYDFEREQGQDFVVDVRLDLDLGRAAETDDVADTVHYGELADRLIEVLTGEPVSLLERLADRLLDICLADPRVAAAEITVHKPQAPIPHEFADVAVTLRRSRQ